MDQPTFADLEYQGKKRKTRREVFLERMDGLIPWQLLEDRIRPFYPKAGRGCHPYPLPANAGLGAAPSPQRPIQGRNSRG